MAVAVASMFTLSFVVCAAGRRWVVAVVVALWPAYFAGLLLDIWGNGVGDGWQYAALAGTVAVTAGAIAGTHVGRRVGEVRPSSKLRPPTGA